MLKERIEKIELGSDDPGKNEKIVEEDDFSDLIPSNDFEKKRPSASRNWAGFWSGKSRILNRYLSYTEPVEKNDVINHENSDNEATETSPPILRIE